MEPNLKYSESPTESDISSGNSLKTAATLSITNHLAIEENRSKLDLKSLGYLQPKLIDWKRIILPEKKNLYKELYNRIAKNHKPDCYVYIGEKVFHCYLIVLQCYSKLFDQYVAVKKIILPKGKFTASAFHLIYQWMINADSDSHLLLNRENVLDIFILAKYMKIDDLLEQCWAFMNSLDVFNEGTAFDLYMDAKKKNLPDVQELMLPRISRFFLILVSSKKWLELDVNDVIHLLNSNYLAVHSEMEIFMAAVRWLMHDWTNRKYYQYDVTKCVRFGNMLPWQLLDMKINPNNPEFLLLTKDTKICKMIEDGQAFAMYKNLYSDKRNDFPYGGITPQFWHLETYEPRIWIDGSIVHVTFRQFLLYLNQIRKFNFENATDLQLVEGKKAEIEVGKRNSNDSYL